MSASVQVFGCRPHEGGAAHSGAGVRKPPREETAGGVRGWRGVGYGDLSAADDVTAIRRHPSTSADRGLRLPPSLDELRRTRSADPP